MPISSSYSNSYHPQLSPKFLLPFHCHFPTSPTKTNLIPFFLPIQTQTQIPKKNHFFKINMSSNNGDKNGVEFDQNVLVMRHGDRMDNFVPSWVTTAERPWDPPLFDAGKTRAFKVGNEIRTQLNFPIHRVFVSPFLRCVQTASEVVSALCASSDGGSAINSSKVKVSIEYGLCEMLNREAIRPAYAPKDGDFCFNISELEAMLPAGTVHNTVERIYQEMPRWEETVLGSRSRYEQVIQALADKYPRENLLLVTHGEGVGTSVSSFKKRAVVYEVNYCAYSHAKRSITIGENGSVKAGDFQLLTNPNETGIGYCITDTLSDGV
ncbi:Protein UBASH3A-like protein [Bienertia sinuspersici]